MLKPNMKRSAQEKVSLCNFDDQTGPLGMGARSNPGSGARGVSRPPPWLRSIAALRNKLSGRITVASLALFNPVDMSTDIDGDPIGRNISSAVVTAARRRGVVVGAGRMSASNKKSQPRVRGRDTWSTAPTARWVA